MKITVVGLGRVGTVAAASLALAGHEVVGVDVDRERVRRVQAAQLPIHEPGLQNRVGEGLKKRLLRVVHRDEVEEDLETLHLSRSVRAQDTQWVDAFSKWSTLLLGYRTAGHKT